MFGFEDTGLMAEQEDGTIGKLGRLTLWVKYLKQ
jgi:hypothetical protein